MAATVGAAPLIFALRDGPALAGELPDATVEERRRGLRQRDLVRTANEQRGTTDAPLCFTKQDGEVLRRPAFRVPACANTHRQPRPGQDGKDSIRPITGCSVQG